MSQKEDLKIILDSIKKAGNDKEMYFWLGRLVQWGYNHLETKDEQR